MCMCMCACAGRRCARPACWWRWDHSPPPACAASCRCCQSCRRWTCPDTPTTRGALFHISSIVFGSIMYAAVDVCGSCRVRARWTDGPDGTTSMWLTGSGRQPIRCPFSPPHPNPLWGWLFSVQCHCAFCFDARQRPSPTGPQQPLGTFAPQDPTPTTPQPTNQTPSPRSFPALQWQQRVARRALHRIAAAPAWLAERAALCRYAGAPLGKQPMRGLPHGCECKVPFRVKIGKTSSGCDRPLIWMSFGGTPGNLELLPRSGAAGRAGAASARRS
jgi:hypothetical protein